ncbi:MAG TPA: translational machinery protein [Burkholderiaceae bacterium]|jgi:stalled ribosome rescue protein Dom34
MSANHAVIWIDHAQALAIYFNAETHENLQIKAHAHASHLHTKSGSPGSGHTAEDKRFFHDVATSVNAAEKILVVGPGLEKTMFFKYLSEHLPSVASKVVGVEASDHPSEAQLLAHARKYFVKADLYH